MVYKQASQRETVKIRTHKTLRLTLVLLLAVIAIEVVCLAAVINDRVKPTGKVTVDEPAIMGINSSNGLKSDLPVKVDFQSVVDAWVRSVGGNKSVVIYDLEREEVVGAYNTKTTYNAASLYKLFVVYEGYRKLQNGEWQANAVAGVTGHTIAQCLDLAIRQSDSECAETLWDMMGRDNLIQIVRNDYEIAGADLENLLASPEDIMKMMRIYYQHQDIRDAGLINQMKASFLDQPATTYNWRQGLPSGFTRATVYNKVGWDYYAEGGYWNVYHDAAIVEFPEAGRHYVVVVMTERVPFEQIRRLGTDIEAKFYNQ